MKIISPRIPSIEHLQPNSSGFTANVVFKGAGPQNSTIYGLVSNLIRLVDRAIAEYEHGRKAIYDYWHSVVEEISLVAGVRSVGYFEGSIDALKRAINHITSIRGNKDVPQSLKDLLPKNSILLTGSVEHQIREMRNAIQHLEKKLIEGKISPGEPFYLSPEEETLSIGSLSIKYGDLADWLKEAHFLALSLKEYIDE